MKGLFKGTGLFILYVVATFVAQFGLAAILVGAARVKGLPKADMVEFVNYHFLATTFFAAILILAGLYFILKGKKIDIKNYLALNSFDFKFCVSSFVSIFFFSLAFNYLIRNITVENELLMKNSAVYLSSKAPGLGTVLLILNMLVLAPIVEEVFCRGIVLATIEKSNSAVFAVTVSSILFALMHFAFGGVELTIGALFLGVLLGYIYVYTGSIYVCILAHIAANLAGFCFF